MRRSPRESIVPVLALGAGLAAVPLAAMHFFSREKVQFGADVHFVGVGLTALPAAAAAVALTIIGARRRDTRTVLVGNRVLRDGGAPRAARNRDPRHHLR